MIKKKTMTYFGTEKAKERRKEERKLLRHSNQLKIIFIEEDSCCGLPAVHSGVSLQDLTSNLWRRAEQ